MLRRRIEKLEAHVPLSPDRLLERLDRKAINSLSVSDRELVNQMLNISGRRKAWPADYRAAEDRFLQSYGMLLREISDDQLAGLISQLERQLGRPLSAIEAIA
jgi:hypothetical protein